MEIDNIAIIVDGPTEKNCLEKCFSKRFNKKPAIRYSPGNGLTYTEEMYAKGVAPSLILLLSKNIYSVFLIPDLERRAKKGKTTIQKFSKDIKSYIIQEILSLAKNSFSEFFLQEIIHVCPSDIMFENWIISDIENVKKSNLIKQTAKQEFFDGQNGSSVISKNMVEGYFYKKTIHAQNMFKHVDITVGVENSPSFSTFITSLDICLNIP